VTRYVVSDLHLDHANIIDYCDRPFEDVDEMNDRLVANWNDVVDPTDTVLFGGDLTVSTEFSDFQQWIDRLNGSIRFVLGNHDTTIVPGLDGISVCEHYQFTFRDVPFLCVHDPADAPSNWDGWVLHGHHHNNWPDEYPFVDHEERRVNVSVELIEYTPIRMSDLLECILEGRRLARLADADALRDQCRGHEGR
jgi:calcineurin-like phosphoesterase family protein